MNKLFLAIVHEASPKIRRIVRCMLLYVIIIFLIATPISAFNRSVFYRASSFWDEPRFIRPGLSTLDIQIEGGSTAISRNCRGDKVPLFALYGPENIRALSRVLPDHRLMLPGNPDALFFKGCVNIFEADFNLYQNMLCGFFFHFHFPVVFLHISPSTYYKDIYCKRKEPVIPVGQKTIHSLRTFLEPFDICTNDRRQSAPGDSTLFFGWSNTYEQTCYLDFIDTTFKTGILFPTGKKKNVDQLFDIAYGYNGHYGVPLSFDIAGGMYDWLTIGAHFDNVFLFKKKQCVRLKTAQEVNTGFITLGKGVAEINPGMVWRVGAYVKADHFVDGLSLLFGYSYEQQNKTEIAPCDRKQFPIDKVNRDEHYQRWSRSIFHFLAEYDFTCENSRFGQRIGIFFDKQLSGKRVFDLSMAGGYLGLDICWHY